MGAETTPEMATLENNITDAMQVTPEKKPEETPKTSEFTYGLLCVLYVYMS